MKKKILDYFKHELYSHPLAVPGFFQKQIPPEMCYILLF